MATIIVSDSIHFQKYFAEKEPMAKMRPASSYAAAVKERFRVGLKHVGLPMHWTKTAELLRFRPGEVTLWGGRNGSGKSLIQGLVMAGLCRLGQRVAIASFEMKPEATLVRLTRQMAGGSKPTDEFIDRFHAWTDGKLWLYDHRGQIDTRHMLAVCRYAREELGIDQLCIDSMMKVVRGEDDYNGQKDFVNALTTIAGDTGMHIHLVHHLRKGDGSARPGTKDDFKGSGSITDQVDNTIIVWRNTEKEEAEREGFPGKTMDPDMLLIVNKQRNGEWEGKIKLYLHRESMQFVANPGDRPIDFMGVV